MAYINLITLLLRPLFVCIIITVFGPTLLESTNIFTIVNNCKEMIWPAITNGGNFTGGGFALKPGQSAVYTASHQWSGRIWARTGCTFDKDGNGKCQTGSCGTLLNCTSPGSPPTSIAEFTLNDIDFYDVSLVDGFNLPIVVKPSNGKGNCSTAGCDGDLRQKCPSELQAKANGRVIACRSACDVFKTDEYCCRGTYGNPKTCHPTKYSRTFKQFCPSAYSFAFDDPTSVITCSGADYTVTFCGSRKQIIVCTYHHEKLFCSGSSSLTAVLSQKWYWGLILALPLMFIDQYFQGVLI